MSWHCSKCGIGIMTGTIPSEPRNGCQYCTIKLGAVPIIITGGKKEKPMTQETICAGCGGSQKKGEQHVCYATVCHIVTNLVATVGYMTKRVDILEEQAAVLYGKSLMKDKPAIIRKCIICEELSTTGAFHNARWVCLNCSQQIIAHNKHKE